MSASTGDMPPEEFRRWAHEVADWIADYLAEVEDFPVLAQVEPGTLRRDLPDLPPERGEGPGPILEDFRRLILPGITHWNHPSFHAYFAVTGSGPGILGEMLSAALNINAMVWRSSPAATELEEHTADWVRALLGLPAEFAGVIQDTASTSSLVALAAARHRAYPEARRDGLFGGPAGRIYASAEAHSSIEKAVMTLGMGQAGMVKIPVDAEFRMRPEALRQAVRRDREQGLRPVAVVATLGTTSTTSVDPVSEIAEVARQEGLWLHVDAAYAGAAAMVPELRHHFEGWEHADSVVFNPHKWLFTPVDCSILFMREPDTVREAFSLVPEYLRTDEQGQTTDLMDFGVALGRRFRSLKLWFVLRYFGAAGLRDRIRAHVAMARELADWIDEAQGWRRVAPVPFSTVVFRLAPEGMEGEESDALNAALLEEVNRQGETFLSHTRLDGRICIRLAIGNLRTTRTHVERAWTLVRAAGDRLLAAGGPGR